MTTVLGMRAATFALVAVMAVAALIAARRLDVVRADAPVAGDARAPDVPCPAEAVSLKNWSISRDGSDWSHVSTLLNPPGDATTGRIRLRHALPAFPCRGKALFLRTVDEAVTVRLDGDVVFSYRPPESAFGYPWLLVPLPPRDAPGALELDVTSRGAHIGLTGIPQLGTSDAILGRLVLSEAPSLLLGTLFVLLGFGAFGVLGLTRTRTPLASYAAFVVVLGLYTLANSRLRQFAADDPALWLRVEYALLYLLPVPAFVFFEQAFPARDVWRARPHVWISAAFAAWALPALAFLSPRAYADLFTAYSGALGLSIALLGLRAALEWWRDPHGFPRALLVGVTAVAASAAADLLAGWGLLPTVGYVKCGNLVLVGVVTWHVARLALEALRREFELRVAHQHQVKIDEAGRLTALGEMAGSVAHEINNPLAIIVGKSQQLAMSLASQAPDAERALADNERIHQAALRLSRIAHSMRLLGRDTSAEKPERVPARVVVRQVLDLAQDKIKLSGIALEVDLGDEETACQCRPVQLGQVILNLLNNAVDALEGVEGGASSCAATARARPSSSRSATTAPASRAPSRIASSCRSTPPNPPARERGSASRSRAASSSRTAARSTTSATAPRPSSGWLSRSRGESGFPTGRRGVSSPARRGP